MTRDAAALQPDTRPTQATAGAGGSSAAARATGRPAGGSGGIAEGPASGAVGDSGNQGGAPAGGPHPFLTAAGVRRLDADADVGGAGFAIEPPAWLGGAGGGLTAGALAALAEVALSTAAREACGPAEDVLTATLHLEVHGYPLADSCVRPAAAPGPRVLAAIAAPPDIQRVLARAEAVDEAGGIPTHPARAGLGRGRRAPLSSATGSLTSPDGGVLAVAWTLGALVPATAGTPLPAADAAAHPPLPAAHPVAPATNLPAAASPAGPELALPVAPLRPLLSALDASIDGDGDRTSVRFIPPGWLANGFGGVHVAAVGAIVDAAVDAALGRVLPAGSAAQVRSLDMTFLRTIPLGNETEAVATIVHIGRRFAVVDCAIGTAGSRPCALARTTAARITHR